MPSTGRAWAFLFLPLWPLTAKLFGLVKPKLAVYSHIVTYDQTDDDIMRRAKAKYAGDVRMGRDMMAMDVGRDRVKVLN